MRRVIYFNAGFVVWILLKSLVTRVHHFVLVSVIRNFRLSGLIRNGRWVKGQIYVYIWEMCTFIRFLA